MECMKCHASSDEGSKSHKIRTCQYILCRSCVQENLDTDKNLRCPFCDSQKTIDFSGMPEDVSLYIFEAIEEAEEPCSDKDCNSASPTEIGDESDNHHFLQFIERNLKKAREFENSFEECLKSIRQTSQDLEAHKKQFEDILSYKKMGAILQTTSCSQKEKDSICQILSNLLAEVNKNPRLFANSQALWKNLPVIRSFTLPPFIKTQFFVALPKKDFFIPCFMKDSSIWMTSAIPKDRLPLDCETFQVSPLFRKHLQFNFYVAFLKLIEPSLVSSSPSTEQFLDQYVFCSLDNEGPRTQTPPTEIKSTLTIRRIEIRPEILPLDVATDEVKKKHAQEITTSFLELCIYGKTGGYNFTKYAHCIYICKNGCTPLVLKIFNKCVRFRVEPFPDDLPEFPKDMKYDVTVPLKSRYQNDAENLNSEESIEALQKLPANFVLFSESDFKLESDIVDLDLLKGLPVLAVWVDNDYHFVIMKNKIGNVTNDFHLLGYSSFKETLGDERNDEFSAMVRIL